MRFQGASWGRKWRQSEKKVQKSLVLSEIMLTFAP